MNMSLHLRRRRERNDMSENRRLRVLMTPDKDSFGNGLESGIRRVVEAYQDYMGYGVQFASTKRTSFKDIEAYDVLAVHAGSTNRFPPNKPIVSHLHGLYWTADYRAESWEYEANAYVIASIKRATIVTVPSEWVAETIRREARIDPVILPHGIDYEAWRHKDQPQGYVLWNKNRISDVCNPEAVGKLSRRFGRYRFVTTYATPDSGSNVTAIAPQKHSDMKKIVQRCSVYLSTVKETFGIGVLEAMASGRPVLGWDYGGNSELVRHGETGYLAKPHNYDDLAQGLEYCFANAETLGNNALIAARGWTWPSVVEKVENVYRSAYEIWLDNQRPLTL